MAERAEESADVAEQKRGRFPGSEVASFFEFGPADDMVVAICETANGHILRQRDGHRGTEGVRPAISVGSPEGKVTRAFT